MDNRLNPGRKQSKNSTFVYSFYAYYFWISFCRSQNTWG